MRSMRSPYNRRPYYCIKCGLGFGEFMACELPDCELESEDAAKMRAAGQPTDTPEEE